MSLTANRIRFNNRAEIKVTRKNCSNIVAISMKFSDWFHGHCKYPKTNEPLVHGLCNRHSTSGNSSSAGFIEVRASANYH